MPSYIHLGPCAVPSYWNHQNVMLQNLSSQRAEMMSYRNRQKVLPLLGLKIECDSCFSCIVSYYEIPRGWILDLYQCVFEFSVMIQILVDDFGPWSSHL